MEVDKRKMSVKLSDIELSENARAVLAKRYLKKNEKGETLEEPIDMFRRVSSNIAEGEFKFREGGEAEALYEEWSGKFLQMMLSRKFMPNSPTLMNAGRELQQLSACFVLPVEDSIDGIYDTLKHQAVIHKSGGGTGFGFSRLRPKNDIVKSTMGVSSGPVSFMAIYDASTDKIKQGGCVVPDTMVSTSRGIVPIRELGPEGAADSWHPHRESLRVATDDGPRASDEFYNHGVAAIRRLRTKSGYRFAATLKHRIRVIDDEGQYVWRRMRDLQPGDWVALQKGHMLEPENYSLPAPSAVAHGNATSVRFPVEVSERFGEFVGYLVGDGSFNQYNRGGTTGRLILSVCDGQPEVAGWLERVCREMFDLTPVVNKKEGDGSANHCLNSTALVGWLHQIGVEKPSAGEARVPSAVFRKGMQMARGFLRGLFTADGTVSKEGYPSLSSVSEALIEDVQQLLLAVGIPSSVSVVSNRDGAFGNAPLYRLRVITRAGIEKFAYHIGFLDSPRNARLTRTTEQSWEFNDVIPHPGKALQTAYAGPGRGSGPMRGSRGANRALYRDIQHYLPDTSSSRNLTRSRLGVLAERHEEISASSLMELLDANQFYDRIEAIEEDESPTLDLSVPANNTYIANGFVSHNTRRGANMGILRVDHPDIEEFITCKNENDQINNFNISVAITDEFMEAVRTDSDFDLKNPRDGEVMRTIRARDLFEKIIHGAWLNGEPGVVFIDKIDGDNPTPQFPIESTNPCSEAHLPPYDSCNLGSINLERFVRSADGSDASLADGNTSGEVRIDWDELRETVHTAVRFLDNVIEQNRYPLPEIDAMSRGNRRIGLGVMGFADALIQLGITYDSDDGLAFAEKMMKFVDDEAWAASRRLAEERGVMGNYKGSRHEKRNNPVRNATVTTIAPTGTISMIAGCSGGIEPLFAVAFMRRQADMEMPDVNPEFVRLAKERGFYSEDLMKKVAEHGSVRDIEEVPEDVRSVWVVSHDISSEWHVKMQAAFQKYTSMGISKTINLPNEATAKDVEDAYMQAFDTGCKGIAVYRDGSRDAQVLSTGATSKSSEAPEPEVRHVSLAEARNGRPKTLSGVTKKLTTGHGPLYVTMNDDEFGPRECFVIIGKPGGTAAAFSDALGRMISLAMTHGASPQEVIHQLRGIQDGHPYGFGPNAVLSVPDGVAKAMGEHYLIDETQVETRELPIIGACPDCGSGLTRQEGCVTCHSCGYSKCS